MEPTLNVARWLVLIDFIVLAVSGWFLIPLESEPGLCVMHVGILFSLLIGICWLKGEPQHWRRGGDS